MRFKAVGIIVASALLVLILGFFWQVKEAQRTEADLIQLGEEKTIQPNVVETENLTLSLLDGVDKAIIGQQVTYNISYLAKKDLKQARIVGALGETKKKIYSTFSWDLGDIKAGVSGSFTVPVAISLGETNLAVSRVTFSEMKKMNWWGKENRQILATVDDINSLVSQ